MNYYDRNQLVHNHYWSLSYLGDNNGDNLIEIYERAEITIFMTGLADAIPLTTDEIFSVALKPPSGSVMIVKRVTPATIGLIQTID